MEKIDFLGGLLIAISVAWVGWASITIIMQGSKIQALQIADEARKNQASNMVGKFDKIETDIKEGFDKINTRFDLFTKREIDILAEALKNK